MSLPPEPYPLGWHAPAPPPSQKTNVLAVVAFVASLVCVPLIPLILAFIALSQIRNRGEKGKGFAIAAIVIQGVALVLVVGLGGLGVLDSGPKRDESGQVTGPGTSDVHDIRTGDCFDTEDDLTEHTEGTGGEAAPSVRIVPCEQPHEGEAYAVFDLEDGPYPGTEKIIALADDKCGGTLLTDYVGDAAKLPQTMRTSYYYPKSGSWDQGDHEVTCVLTDSSGSSTGSVRAPGS
ncbi:septum formation family protein [Streptomyces sp. NPDC088762]|uniref:DUF4190 domain-containing protein n=1 Tax=Streptomyces sp. NPDC088762 TaxID=3365891 RepID=UPI00381605AD